jgi:hypothetical protein
MMTIDELRQLAHDLYSAARASADPAKKRLLMRAADGYLRQVDEMRRGHVATNAKFPKSMADCW